MKRKIMLLTVIMIMTVIMAVINLLNFETETPKVTGHEITETGVMFYFLDGTEYYMGD